MDGLAWRLGWNFPTSQDEVRKSFQGAILVDNLRYVKWTT
jgi:hypothetical protein